MVLNFVKKWDGHLPSTKPIVYAVLGSTNLEDYFTAIYKDQEILNRKVIVKKFDSLEELKKSGERVDVIFVSRYQKKYINEIVNYCEVNHILSISDTKGFSKEGIHVTFYIEYSGTSGTIKYRINQTKAKASGIQFNYMILERAVIIY